MAARAPDTVIKTHNATARTAKSQPMNGRIMSTLNTMARMVSGNVKLNASLDSCAVNGPRSRNTAKTIAEGTQPKIAPKWRSEERRVGKEGRGRRGTDDRRKEEKTDE